MALEIVEEEYQQDAPRASRPGPDDIVSLGRHAPQDKRTKRRVQINDPDTGRMIFALSCEFYVNRIHSKPTELTEEETFDIAGDEEAITSRKNAKWMCEWLASWNLGGDSAIEGFVGDDEIVPIVPEMVELVPLWVRNQVVDVAMEIINPNLRRSRTSRRR